MIDVNVQRAFYRNAGAETIVLRDVEIKINDGDCLTIIGPSGCGKSTLLKIIAGLHREYEGNVPRLSKVGYMPQANSLLPWKTVLQNTVSLKEAVDSRYDKDYAKELLSGLGIEALSNRYPSQLSGGQLQRVALARALFLEPCLLLMDEPFSALDEMTREEMQDVFLNIRKKYNFTAVCITHSIEEALILGDEIQILSGTPGTVIYKYPNKSINGRSSQNRNSEFYAGVEALRSVIGCEQGRRQV